MGAPPNCAASSRTNFVSSQCCARNSTSRCSAPSMGRQSRLQPASRARRTRTTGRNSTLGAHLISGLNALFTGKRPGRERAPGNQHVALRPAPPGKAVAAARNPARGYGRRLSGTGIVVAGYPDQALARCNEALDLAQTPSISLSITQAMAMLALLHQARGDYPTTRHWVHQASKHAHDQGHPYWSALAGVLAGWLRANDGQVDAGVQDISSEVSQRTSRLARCWAGPGSCCCSQKPISAESATTKPSRRWQVHCGIAKKTGEAYYAAEIHRTLGRSAAVAAGGTRQLPCGRSALSSRSLEIAQRQGARVLGTADRDEPGPAVAGARQVDATASAVLSRICVQPVHRRLRYPRLAGGRRPPPATNAT